MKTKTFIYKFYLPKQKEIEYRIDLDLKSKIRINEKPTPEIYKPFTDLENKKCSNCPLNKVDNPECPVAKNMVEIVGRFKGNISHERIEIKVESKNRNYSKEVDLQNGLRSLLGLLMASSECPHMDFLRPMAIFHLPFSDTKETIIRTLSFYLTDRFLKDEFEGLSLEPLIRKYGELEKVNHGILERIRSFETGDANQNAVIILNSFISMLAITYEEDLKEIREFFLST